MGCSRFRSDRTSPSGPLARRSAGFTLIEILVSIAIILVLVGLGLPAYQSIRQNARKTEARHTVSQLTQALLLYRDADSRRRFPAEEADRSLCRPLLETLEVSGTFTVGGRQFDDLGRLLDPWKVFFRYQISARPSPASGAAVMTSWNWDPVANHERAWGQRVANGVVGTGAFPFPYVWSLGPSGSSTDATEWIFANDAVDQP